MSQRVIEDYQGKKHSVDCIGCFLSGLGKDVPGYVLVTENFHAHQDFEIPIPGFIILSTRRHIKSLEQFTDMEAAEFIQMLRKIRRAQQEVLGIETVYLIQEEDSKDHFHMWMLPRYPWMEDEKKFGRKVSSARPVLEYAAKFMKTSENIAKANEATEKLRQYLEC